MIYGTLSTRHEYRGFDVVFEEASFKIWFVWEESKYKKDCMHSTYVSGIREKRKHNVNFEMLLSYWCRFSLFAINSSHLSHIILTMINLINIFLPIQHPILSHLKSKMQWRLQLILKSSIIIPIGLLPFPTQAPAEILSYYNNINLYKYFTTYSPNYSHC
jgi:hypothetical protein